MKNNKVTWKDLKAVISDKAQAEQLKLIGDLYSLNDENKTFIHARYLIGKNGLQPYKEIISDALYPDVMWNDSIQLSVGRKAISDYYKATKDKLGQIELMVFYVETGNQFTLDIGDIDESFYSSLESMFDRALTAIEKQPNKIQIKFLHRLSRIVVSAKDMGWGYYDYISESLEEFNDKCSYEKK
ncbi:MAG: hypothetical protein QM479_12020 [Pseudomonadota bacterium]